MSLVKYFVKKLVLIATLLGISGMNEAVQAGSWNNPNSVDHDSNVGYIAFDSSPKTLDPARSYSTDEAQFIGQIYEPPLQYHYLLRPYTLVPLVAQGMPIETYYNAQNQAINMPADLSSIAYTVYTIAIQPGVFYQPHPAFAKDKMGNYYYLHLRSKDLRNIHRLSDFKHLGTRELIADDFVNEITRLADPAVQSPIAGLMSSHIVGFKEALEHHVPLVGVKILDRYHYQIKIYGYYPQFKYWLAMTFFAPMPWEAIAFYQQPGMTQRNITLDWYPIGTGPYFISQNNPNHEIILDRNPYFHPEYYPTEGAAGDAEKGYLEDSGKRLPFVDRFVFTLERENIPRWNKFLQGYFDRSGVGEESFNQAIHLDAKGHAHLTKFLLNRHMRLASTINPDIFYTAFNMLDPVVGGYGDKAQKLRQAIGIAFDEEEFINIFLNGRGIPAQGPLPPEIFGYEPLPQGLNPWVYNYYKSTGQANKLTRKPLSEAQQLLTEAGYPGGIDPQTKQPLVLNYDAISTGSSEESAEYNWIRKQFAKLGIQVNIRSTLYNRFQDKVQTGGVQIFGWAWTADYPDPENFLFLLYGPNSIVKQGGENTANYQNQQADALFHPIAVLPNGPLRLKLINQFVDIVRKDSPWLWGFNPIYFTISQPWVHSYKPNALSYNSLKYLQIDGKLRAKLRKEWNHPVIWPIWILVTLVLALVIPLLIIYWLRELRPKVNRY